MSKPPSCKHCEQAIIPCPHIPSAFCKGWKHAKWAKSKPVISHFCEGKGERPLAEPEVPARTGAV